MDKKVVWITGASSGIGRALAEQYAVKKHTVVISSRKESDLVALKEELEKYGARIIVAPLDLEKTATLRAVAEKVIAETGHIDILYNHGGISQRGFAINMPEEVERKIFDIDYFGNIALTKAVLPTMIARGGGKIGVTSSLVGIISTPERTTYAAAKHALHGYYDGLRAELHDKNIQITIFCPGFVRTNVSVNALTKSGDKLNEMDEAQEKGMAPEVCASKMIRALNKGKEEVYIGGKEVLAIYIKRFFPTLFSKMILKVKSR